MVNVRIHVVASNVYVTKDMYQLARNKLAEVCTCIFLSIVGRCYLMRIDKTLQCFSIAKILF